MQPATLTIHEIFEKERRYTVPLFQRAYVWTLEDQWEPLWEDIERQARSCLIALREERQVSTSHFLGAVVFNVAKVFGRGLARSEVIDGQQRLTTLQVFLAALRDFADAADDEVADDARRLTFNPIRDRESEERLKVWPTNADREVFKTVMTAGSVQNVRAALGTGTDGGKVPLPKLAEAYSYFHEAISGFVDGAEDGGEDADEAEALKAASRADRLYAVLHALKTTLQVVVIELEERDDPQVIFETLNARGQPLLPSDLIRNTVFLDASGKGKDIDRLYTNYWRHFDERRVEDRDDRGEDRFWHLVERQGRLTRPRIDLFIFHDLTVRTERELNIGRLFREFRDWYSNSQITTEDYLASLKSHSDHFARLIVPYGSNRVSAFARRLRSLDTSTVHPILLLLMELTPERLSPSARDRIVADLESYLVRRFVCQLTTKNYNRFFLSLLRRLKRASEEREDMAEVARSELLKPTEPTVVWPSDNAFRNSWFNRPLYVKSRSDRSAMILQALNDALRTSKSESIILPEQLTVEHLLPQEWEAHYPLPNGLPLNDEETAEQRRQRLVNTVGNLTLLTGQLNTSISNGPFKDKVREIAKLSDLRLNAPFREREYDRWDEHDILKRGEELFETARAIWPRPDAPAADDVA
jgi:uncharacterized protein with ParB-like and HNH nuclease domain